MSDTQETDAELYPMNGVDIIWPEFARKLERERNEARKDVEQLKDRLANTEDQLDLALICLRKHEGQLIEREP